MAMGREGGQRARIGLGLLVLGVLQRIPESWIMGFGGLVLGSRILSNFASRATVPMSGFYYGVVFGLGVWGPS